VSIKHTLRTEAKAIIISIEGRIVTDNDTADLLKEIQGNIEEDYKIFCFDLNRLEYITSSGLNFFVRILTRTRNVGAQVTLCGIQGNVEKLFAISKLNEIFTFSPSLTEALNNVNAQ
jgi:anti-sigma B factor antagonist